MAKNLSISHSVSLPIGRSHEIRLTHVIKDNLTGAIGWLFNWFDLFKHPSGHFPISFQEVFEALIEYIEEHLEVVLTHLNYIWICLEEESHGYFTLHNWLLVGIPL